MTPTNLFRHLSSAVLVSCLMGACAYGAGANDKKDSTGASSYGQSSNSPSSPAGVPSPSVGLSEPVTDPAYRLSKGDEIAINVFGEGDFSTAQRIDNKGLVRLPYAGDITIADRTVRDAESFLEKLYVEKKLLRKPMVTISVRDYASREVSVLGAVGGTGKYRLPKESSSVEILDVITGMGGFKATAKSDEVKVTRILDSGEEKVITVDVESMINPRRASANSPRSFLIYPGDRIFVPERLW
jgi:protein involved in polysaccharide export with SLBB domain